MAYVQAWRNHPDHGPMPDWVASFPFQPASGEWAVRGGRYGVTLMSDAEFWHRYVRMM